MDTDSLFRELKPDVEQPAPRLIQGSCDFVKARGMFLPHGAVLTAGDEVRLVMALPPGEDRPVSTIEILLEPDLFDTYIAMDPSLWWNAQTLLKGADALLRGRPPVRRALFLASSDEAELVTVPRQLAAVLEKGAFPGVEWHYVPLPEEKHSTIYHPAALRAFRTVFKPGTGKVGGVVPELSPAAALPAADRWPQRRSRSHPYRRHRDSSTR